MSEEPIRTSATWASVVVAIVDGLALLVTGVVVAAQNVHAPVLEDGAVVNLVAGPTFPLLAALMFRSGSSPGPRGRERLAWLFLGLGVVCTATSVVFTYVAVGLRNGAPLTSAAAWVESWLWIAVVPGIEVLLLWFPTGDVVGPRWRWAVRGAGAAAACMWLGTAFAPGPNGDFAVVVDNPLGWDAVQPVLEPVGAVGHALLVVVFVASVASLVVRYRRGGDRVRAQLRWLLLALVVIGATIAIPASGPLGILAAVVNVLATVLLPVTLAVALTRAGYALPRVLVYGMSSAVLLIVYLTVVGVADAAFGTRWDRASAVAAAGLVAVLAAPVRSRLQRGVDRLVYGARGDPYAALTDLGRRIAGSPDDLLDEVVGTVAQALRAPYVAVEVGGQVMASVRLSAPSDVSVGIPLTFGGRQIGRLVVGERGSHEQYGRRDLALLEELARPIAVAAHAAALTQDLQRSRESLVLAREEERRRIRRDLHDGLGPALAGVAFGLDAARNVLVDDPAAAERALGELKGEVQTSLAEVRRLVYDLRPPVLDQLGIVPAVAEFAARLGERTALDISVCAPPMPSLPAAVEVATFRIVIEALNNVARHARASRVTVSFQVTGSTLRVEVADDGVGMPPMAQPGSGGVGLPAMVERAAELGGSCAVTRADGGGTSVLATLPLRAAS